MTKLEEHLTSGLQVIFKLKMSNQSIIIVDDGPNDQEDPDVMFLTSVTKVHSDDCVFIEEVARSVPTRPATNTLDTFNNGPLNLTKRARRDNQEDKNFPVRKKQTTDVSTNTMVITAESHAAEIGIGCCVCYEQKSATFNCFHSTTCGHVYCTGCINKILGSNKTCAVCRKKLTKKQYHRIFF